MGLKVDGYSREDFNALSDKITKNKLGNRKFMIFYNKKYWKKLVDKIIIDLKLLDKK